MTLNINYTLVISLYALFAYTFMLTVFSLAPMPAEPSRKLILAKRVSVAVCSTIIMITPGAMQGLLASHPVYYSCFVVVILFHFLRKKDSIKALLSMTLLTSTIILSCALNHHQTDLLEAALRAIAQPDFLGIR